MAALAQSSAWSQRESDLLTVTLQLLQHHGYERLTLDAVATSARASKATIYRRWGSKAELVLAALVQGAEHNAKAPDTGTLRGDLLQLGKAMCEHARKQASTIRAVLMELSRNPALADVMQRQFLGERAGSINHILRQAVERGEIKKDSIDTELWDLLPGYLIFRSVVSRRRPTQRTVRALVDDVIIPGLSRPTQYRLPNLEAGGDE
ncbi:TetR/AcrR family transcriptional regulator [Mycobacterium sp. 1465703.0]|uniref:TetR/AcrR family transcriptional regulator n=1 Tax=Mycobacterium sp. 1465703.0 TaxID=1834078 RepID=UPI0008000144|nr:TetR/AcrR family transcriptional regulator [Mycobacterium sp. 1465703.0]OBJ10566.1 TetR family transcriptional regulator [Mycobacterium sp. 1465703.0]